jgi:uncharacterized protein YqgQ
MGVIHGRDLLSSKFPTAIIIDSVGAAHFVPIKNPIGDYFFTTINKELFVFNTRTQPYAWRQSMAKTFGIYIYFTDNYNPVTSHVKELELILEKNDLGRFGDLTHRAFSILKRHEKKEFETTKVLTLVESLKKEKISNPERYAQNEELIQWLLDLPVDEIVTPVRRVTEYLDETFLAPDPAIFGAIKTALGLLLTQNKEVNHVEIKAKTGWMKIIAVTMIIGLLGAVGFLLYDGGYLDSLGDAIGSPLSGMSDQQIMTQYPNAASLKNAVDSGKLDYNSLSPAVKKIYDEASQPTVTP